MTTPRPSPPTKPPESSLTDLRTDRLLSSAFGVPQVTFGSSVAQAAAVASGLVFGYGGEQREAERPNMALGSLPPHPRARGGF